MTVSVTTFFIKRNNKVSLDGLRQTKINGYLLFIFYDKEMTYFTDYCQLPLSSTLTYTFEKRLITLN